MSSTIRLVALDIDGTLLDTQYQLPPRNRDALEAAHRAGVEIVLVTGRRYTFALPIAQMLPFEVTMITSNGALVKSSGGVAYMRNLLPLETAAKILAATRAWTDFTVLAYDVASAGQLVLDGLERRSAGFLGWLERNRQYVTFAPVEQALRERAPEDPLQVMYSGPVEVVAAIERTLLALPGSPARAGFARDGVGAPFAGEFRLEKTEYVAKDLTILDAIHPRCSKGNALQDWAARRGLGRDEVMAIGDNFNDLEMLQFAGVAVVMGNAVDGLKCNGWKVTGHCDQAGVAEALEKWVL